MEYYLWVDEQQQGPFSGEDLHKLVASGEVAEETNAWRAGLREWMPLSEVLAEDEAQAKQASLKASKPQEPLKMTRSHSGAAPVLKVGTTAQPLAKATTAVRASATQPIGQVAAKTVSIQGSLKRGLAADLSQSAGQTQVLSSATSNLVPHSATQAQTVRVTGATATQYQQVAVSAEDGQAAAVPAANGKAIVGFVLGVLSVGIPPLCFLALVGIFFSVAAKGNPHRAKLNLWGLILNILGIVFFLIALICIIVFWALIQAYMNWGEQLAQEDFVEQDVVAAVENWAEQNNGRAPRGSQGKEIIAALGYEGEVMYIKKSGNDLYQLQFPGEDGEFDTDDDIRKPKRIEAK